MLCAVLVYNAHCADVVCTGRYCGPGYLWSQYTTADGSTGTGGGQLTVWLDPTEVSSRAVKCSAASENM